MDRFCSHIFSRSESAQFQSRFRLLLYSWMYFFLGDRGMASARFLFRMALRLFSVCNLFWLFWFARAVVLGSARAGFFLSPCSFGVGGSRMDSYRNSRVGLRLEPFGP